MKRNKRNKKKLIESDTPVTSLLNRIDRYFVLVCVLILGVLFGYFYTSNYWCEPLQEQKILGLATETGCLETNYSDIELMKNVWVVTEAGQEPPYLCLLPQNFTR